MSSLPISHAETDPPVSPLISAPAALTIAARAGQAEDERTLLRAFRAFTKVSAALEQSYASLEQEVERLRRELKAKDGDLARSVAARRDARIHLQRILESLPCGVLVLSDRGEILETNPEALRLLHVASFSATGRALCSALPGAIQDLLASTREQGGEQEAELPGEGSDLRWIAARSARIGATASVFSLRDVSDRKRLESAQAKLHRELALAEMSAVLAHEVRNPLGSLELFAGLLADSGLEGERAEWVEHVQAGLRTLAATVNNVLHFYRVPRPNFAPVDVGELLEWARTFCAPVARQSGVTLSSQHEVSGILIEGDRHCLEQVLLNLVLNSVRALAGTGWIQLSGHLAGSGSSVKLAVADNGPGISRENLPKLFHAGFTSHPGGAGLGLAVCRRIVEQHRGSIQAESAPAGGASFTLTFPVSSHPERKIHE